MIKEKVEEILGTILETRKLEDGRMGIEDNNVSTNLISKNYSPMIVRKYNIVNGWPLYLGIICDQSLNDLDEVVTTTVKFCLNNSLITNKIQDARNFTGILSETILNYYNDIKYGSMEGIGIMLYVDKMAVSSLYGDFMNHGQCRDEMYKIINIMTKI
jgi:hypothetical protein